MSMNYKQWFLVLMVGNFINFDYDTFSNLIVYRNHLIFNGFDAEFIDYYEEYVKDKISFGDWCDLIVKEVLKETKDV